QWSFNGHTMVIRWSYDGHTMVIRWSFNGHSMVIQWSYDGPRGVVHRGKGDALREGGLAGKRCFFKVCVIIHSMRVF
ncbi:MAG: hypothetical protein HXX13_15540, partial [Bacteroidetes bacterium]|nr:hypothetical protein [Bacteroidota bacterium]